MLRPELKGGCVLVYCTVYQCILLMFVNITFQKVTLQRNVRGLIITKVIQTIKQNCFKHAHVLLNYLNICLHFRGYFKSTI